MNVVARPSYARLVVPARSDLITTYRAALVDGRHSSCTAPSNGRARSPATLAGGTRGTVGAGGGGSGWPGTGGRSSIVALAVPMFPAASTAVNVTAETPSGRNGGAFDSSFTTRTRSAANAPAR